MKEIHIADVGDGQSIGMKTNDKQKIMLDFGGANFSLIKGFNRMVKNVFSHGDELEVFLSHLHKDHYCYIETYSKETQIFSDLISISSFSYPVMPTHVLKYFFFDSIIEFLLVESVSIEEYNIIDQIINLNINAGKSVPENFRVRLLHNELPDIQIGQSKIKVLWPPINLVPTPSEQKKLDELYNDYKNPNMILLLEIAEYLANLFKQYLDYRRHLEDRDFSYQEFLDYMNDRNRDRPNDLKNNRSQTNIQNKLQERLNELAINFHNGPTFEVYKEKLDEFLKLFDKLKEHYWNGKSIGVNETKKELFEKFKELQKLKENCIKNLFQFSNHGDAEEFFSLNDYLTSALNKYSLSLLIDEKILFLGDLSDKSISKMIESKLDPISNLDLDELEICLCAHHGTHWHNRLKDFEDIFDFVVASNGIAHYYKTLQGYHSLAKTKKGMRNTFTDHDQYFKINFNSSNISKEE